jgi:hypothetical protein
MNRYEDEQYLRLLSLFHYVVGGLTALVACIPIFHFTVGVGMIIASFAEPRETGLLVLPGLAFTLIAGGIMLFGWTFALCIALTGYFLSARRNYMFCLVMAGIETILTPFGTVLGVFTIILLVRPSVKMLFRRIETV